jgi:hypothetical protein
MSDGSHIGAAGRPTRRTRRLAWASAIAILVAGVVAAVVVFAGGSSRPTARTVDPASVGSPAKQSPAAPRNVTLDPAAKRVLGRFVLTAVARKNLQAAYDLAGPGIRQGMSLKQWLTGSIPVVPYEVSSLRYAPFKIDYAHPDHALVEVAMIPTDKASKRGLKSQIFFADIVRIGGKWFVNSWVPRGFPMLPSDQNHG